MLTTLITIWLLHLAALVVPGANVLYITYLAASHNSRTAAFASMGIALGVAIWSSASILGVHIIFDTFPQLRLVIKVLGVIYLLYIATLLWRTNLTNDHHNLPPFTTLKAITSGLLVNLTNPKAAMFFGSVFSATLPANPSSFLLFSSVIVVVLNSLCFHLFLSYAFSREIIQLRYYRYNNTINRTASVIFGSLGCLLLANAVSE
ncbi:MAG: LysE family transporter [Gammaproteobacteria bacterium]|nr:LysE family transporter [Gammaproteobacteria bacterium]